MSFPPPPRGGGGGEGEGGPFLGSHSCNQPRAHPGVGIELGHDEEFVAGPFDPTFPASSPPRPEPLSAIRYSRLAHHASAPALAPATVIQHPASSIQYPVSPFHHSTNPSIHQSDRKSTRLN